MFLLTFRFFTFNRKFTAIQIKIYRNSD
ncbi:hypothetical protein OCT59_020285 [Rhizophagus irregularis]|nr:hypothetical protein OCT59_020285 [Rhizophagus irregularis]